ncbi:MAG: hypothetical protein AB7Q42_01660 [Acidimicrobiia bacterium]
MISPTTVLTIGVLAVIGVRLVAGLRHSLTGEGRALVVRIVSGLGWRHVWPVPFVLTAVVVVASALLLVPGLDWGWWTALGGTGNPVTGGTDQAAGTVWEWLVPLVFVGLLLPALPLFAYAEEHLFRRGAERWTNRRRALKILQFGLVHTIIGVPIGVALALSVGGAYFMHVYLRAYRVRGSVTEATLESTRAHTAYNGTIIVLVLVLAALTALGV